LSLFLGTGIVAAQTVPIADIPIKTHEEDRLIMQALLAEEAGDFARSRDLYERLFTLTGDKTYLIREARNALTEEKFQSRSIANLTRWVTTHPTDHDKELYFVLAALYIQTDALTEADEIVDTYLTKGDVDPDDLREFATLKIELGEYAQALDLLRKAYAKDPNERTALQIASLYLNRLKQPDKAIETLRKQIDDDPTTSVGTYFKLIEMYAKDFRLDKVLALYKRLYRKDPQKYFLQKIIEISLYQKDIDGLIRFIETTKGNDTLLYAIYKDNGLLDKAMLQARKLYRQTRQPKWLAEEAILTYETARKNHAVTAQVLQTMSRLFDRAFEQGDKKGVYLNYYGYTLIDHDMDIDKGIDLVRRALGKEPNNPYYLDSLAWGLYKKGQCKNAFKLMRQVIAKEGLNEPEIRDHYKAIKACLTNRKHRR
jgi:tetratricopeptide (TPR) repeat protein